MTLLIATDYVADATITYGIDRTAHDADMPHKVAVAISLQLPSVPAGTGRVHTDTVWVAPIGDETDAELRHKGFVAFLSFLSAAAEAYAAGMRGLESDNGSLFPADVMEWAYINSDAIEMAHGDEEDMS